jgi:hypothetical protein
MGILKPKFANTPALCESRTRGGKGGIAFQATQPRGDIIA